MIPLSTTYRKNGYEFRQVDRTKNVAIYSQHDTENGRLVAYEVFIVKQRPRAL